jgi:hypothetical protein
MFWALYRMYRIEARIGRMIQIISLDVILFILAVILLIL